MNRTRSPDRRARSRWPSPAITAAGLSLAALAGGTRIATWWAERRYPPIGEFVTVDGVRLHVLDKGDGPAVMLLHGIESMMQDFSLSILHGLTRHFRVIIPDRPGYGYSERPSDRIWTPEAQAALMHGLMEHLGVRDALILGHSFGASVALSYAAAYPRDVRGAILIAGYYFPTLRADMVALALPAVPVLGPLMCHTLAPAIGRLVLPRWLERLFAPNPIPPNFHHFPVALMLRPGPIKAAAEDMRSLRPWARRMRHRYGRIRMPVSILSGSTDQIVDVNRQSTRLHREMPTSSLRVLPGVGHMLHHVRPDEVLHAVASFDAAARVETSQVPGL